MLIRKGALLAAISLGALASAAHAADMAQPAPAGFNWGGFYIGAGGGFGGVNHKLSLNTPGGSGSLNGIGGEGVFGELTGGYDQMLGERILLGGFIDAHVGNIGPSLDADPFINADLTNTYGFDVGARLGYVLNANTLGYVLGGYSWQRFKLDGDIGGTGFSFHDNRGGYVLGVGMETAVGGNWTIKTEYRYADYGTDTILDLGATTLGVEPSTHTFHVAANYHFGGQSSGSAIETPAYNWTGFYVGAGAGAGEVVHDISLLGGAADLNGLGGEGVFGQINAGYDRDFGQFVAGVILDGDLSGISSKLDSDVGLSAKLKADYGLDALARLGWKLNGTTLAYALGGYSWSHFKAEASLGAASGSFDWNSSGFSVGGGLETVVAANTTLGLEYRYSQFANKDFSADLGAPADTLKVEPSFHTVRLNLNYKFN